MPKVSIVSAYYNRKKSLWRTLKTVEKSQHNNLEFIVVDDASDESQRLEDFLLEFDFLKLIRIDPKNKSHINPCIPFNMGFKAATGDFIIIQAPECIHVGDVIGSVVNNLKDDKYLVFSCYALSKETSDKLSSVDFNLSLVELESSILNTVGSFHARSTIDVGKNDSWVIHPKHRPAHYNFLTAITSKDLYDLGGFDERFASGYAYDDTEFAARITKKGMDVVFIESPFCLHDFHADFSQRIVNRHIKEARNKKLYEECVKSPNYRVDNLRGIE